MLSDIEDMETERDDQVTMEDVSGMIISSIGHFRYRDTELHETLPVSILLLTYENEDQIFDHYADFCRKERIVDVLPSLDPDIKNLLSRCLLLYMRGGFFFHGNDGRSWKWDCGILSRIVGSSDVSLVVVEDSEGKSSYRLDKSSRGDIVLSDQFIGADKGHDFILAFIRRMVEDHRSLHLSSPSDLLTSAMRDYRSIKGSEFGCLIIQMGLLKRERRSREGELFTLFAVLLFVALFLINLSISS